MSLSKKYIKFPVVMLVMLLSVLADSMVFADDEIIMGIFPRRNAEVTFKMYTPMAEYLSKKLGVKVQVETEKSFPRFWDKVLQGRYDIVHYNQLHYLLSHKSVGYEVFAQNEEMGHSSLAPAIVVRKDSGVNTIQDLKGKNIVFGGGKLAMVAYVGNKLLLLENGLMENDYNSMLSINPPNATFSVFHKKADAAAVGDIALDVAIVKNKIDVNELKYLVVGKSQPHLPWAYKTDLKPEIVEGLKNELVILSKSDEGRAVLKSAGLTNILPVSDQDYDVSRDTYREFKKLTNK